jgi:ABC-type transport system substrate-binding protein
MSAAGFPNGFTVDFIGPTGAPYGTNYTRYAQALGGMFSEGGIKLEFKEATYPGDYVNNYNYNQAFNGISIFVNTTYGGVANNLRTNWHSASAQDRSPYAPTKINKPAGGPKDETLDGLIQKLLGEQDRAKAVSLAHDIQRHLTKVLYTIPFYHKVRGLSLTWPWVRTPACIRLQSSADGRQRPWYDASKRRLSASMPFVARRRQVTNGRRAGRPSGYQETG